VNEEDPELTRTHGAFSQGMDWANFSRPFDILGEGVGAGRGRRTAKECAACGLCTGKKLFDKLIVCVSFGACRPGDPLLAQ